MRGAADRTTAGPPCLRAAAGVGPAALTELARTELDRHHVLTRTTWAAPRTDQSGEVTMSSPFLLRRDGGRFRVLAYITHRGLPP